MNTTYCTTYSPLHIKNSSNSTCKRKLMIKTFLICHFFTFSLCLNSINSDNKHCSCQCNLKNIRSIKLKCSHRRGYSQACVWLILRHFKLKLSVKMHKKFCPSAPFMLFIPEHQLFPKLLVLWLTNGKMLLPKKSCLQPC